MDNRFQFVLLTIKAVALATAFLHAPVLLADDGTEKTDISDINNEVFELGVFAGIINIEDFGSELAPGVSLTFRASEDFFIQSNYLQADVSLSAYEASPNQDPYFSGDKRTFTHYDLLIGYNLFQGEFFPSPASAKLSALYVVAGVGETEFGGESSFTYTLGFGYEVAIARHLGVHIDFRDYLYQSILISAEKRMVSAAQVSIGAKYLF
jgi:outer membrane beta-barrel protein